MRQGIAHISHASPTMPNKIAKGSGRGDPRRCGFPDCAKAADDISRGFYWSMGGHASTAGMSFQNQVSVDKYVIGICFVCGGSLTAIPKIAMLTMLKLNGCSPMEASSRGIIGYFQCPGERCRQPQNGVWNAHQEVAVDAWTNKERDEDGQIRLLK